MSKQIGQFHNQWVDVCVCVFVQKQQRWIIETTKLRISLPTIWGLRKSAYFTLNGPAKDSKVIPVLRAKEAERPNACPTVGHIYCSVIVYGRQDLEKSVLGLIASSSHFHILSP